MLKSILKLYIIPFNDCLRVLNVSILFFDLVNEVNVVELVDVAATEEGLCAEDVFVFFHFRVAFEVDYVGGIDGFS